VNWDDHIERHLRQLGADGARRAEIRRELAQHLQDRYDELRAGGASHDAALQETLDELGDGSIDASEPRGGAAWSPGDLVRELRYALRTLTKSAAFSAVVVATLAIGIGANTAIFSVVNAVMLRPLPYDPDDRLVVVWGNLHKPGLEEIPASAAEFVDYRDRNRVFDAIAAYDTTAVNVTGLDRPERIAGAVSTASLFGLLQATPVLGRVFTAADEQPGRAPALPAAVRTGLPC